MISREKIQQFSKWFMLAGIYSFLLLPLLQDTFEFKKWIDPLNGSFTQEKDTSFSAEGWFSGGYQAQKEKFLRDSFGLHNYYIRLNGQVNFQLFKKAGVVYVIVGKNNYLYEVGYFYSYYGKDFVGKKRIELLIDTLSRLQDTLRKAGKLLLPVIAPGKGFFYPEYIPRQYRQPVGISNYEYFTACAKRRRIDFIDFNGYFVEQKHKSKYPLYPQYGIHWSNYGAVMAFDSIVKYVESTLNMDLPDIIFRQPSLSDSLRNTDDDIIKGMNLLYEPRTFKMAYPEWSVVNDTTRHCRPRLLVVGDSFWWYIYSTGLPGSVFSGDRFWFYNEAAYPESFTSPLSVKKMDYKKVIRESDVILILNSESTMWRFSNGFVELCFDTYFPEARKKVK